MLDQNLASRYPNVSFNTPAAPQGNWLQRAAGALSQGINNRPELFAIGADMIGQNLDPQNAFAGVGTHLGQGSLASKEKEKIESTNEKLMKLIEALTGADQSGGTSMSFKRGKSGLEMSFKGNLMSDSHGTKYSPTTMTQGEAQGRSVSPIGVANPQQSKDIHNQLRHLVQSSGR